MDKIAVTFCGRKCLCLTKTGFRNLALNLEAEFVKFFEANSGRLITFYFSGQGAFEGRARAVLYDLKDKYEFKTILVSAIPLSRRAKIGGFDGAVFPFPQPLVSGSPARRRNEWLVDNADVMFSFSPLKSAYDNLMLDYARTQLKVTGKPEIIFVSAK